MASQTAFAPLWRGIALEFMNEQICLWATQAFMRLRRIALASVFGVSGAQGAGLGERPCQPKALSEIDKQGAARPPREND